MNQGLGWYRGQSGHNREHYEWLHKALPSDAADWKVVALFYSALHRVNYHLFERTGKHPKNHAERNRRVEAEMPLVFDDYRDLYMMGVRARYRDGFRTRDYARRRALELVRSWNQHGRLHQMRCAAEAAAAAAPAAAT